MKNKTLKWVIGIFFVIAIIGGLGYAVTKIDFSEVTGFTAITQGEVDEKPLTETITEQELIDESLIANVGESSTITILFQDQEPDTVTARTGLTGNVYQDGTRITDGTTGISSVSTSVAKRITAVVINESYYSIPIVNKLVTEEADTWNMKVFTTTAESSLTLTIRDSFGNELNKESGETYGDYNTTLAANEKESYQMRLRNTGNDNTYWAKGFCYASTNDADDLGIPTENTDWSRGYMPKNVSKAKILVDASNTTEYDVCWIYKDGTDEVIQLKESGYVDLDFTLKCSSTDCTNNSNEAEWDAFYINWFDASWFETADGGYDFGYYDGTENELNVGVEEPFESPVGLTSGAVIKVY